MSVYDEVLCATAMDRVMRERGITAALVAGPDWPLIDPDGETGCGAIVARHLELPEQHKLVFSQAPPGLAGCLISAGLMQELSLCNRLSTVGGLLVYQPQAPQHDPIARSVNVQIDHTVRGCRYRCTFDAPRYRRQLEAVIASVHGTAGRDVADLGAAEVIALLSQHAPPGGDEPPRHVVVELCSRRPDRDGPRCDMDLDVAAALFEQVAAPGDVVVTFAGAGDPLLHERFDELVRLARRAGVRGVHVRTELRVDHAVLDRLLACEPDVISVDLHGDSPESYRRVTGVDRYQDVLDAMEYLVNNRRRLTDHAPTAALALPWIVPRMTRRLETVEDIDGFYDRWQGTLGTVVIDPLPDLSETDLLPVVVPPAVQVDEDRLTLTVLSDGSVRETARQ